MLSTEITLQTYDESFWLLVKKFVNVYYSYEDWDVADYYIIWEWWWLAPNTVEINDEFRHINQIYEALKHNIPKKILFEWYYYSLERASKNVKRKEECKEELFITNLVHYHKWAPKYTQKELEESQKKV